MDIRLELTVPYTYGDKGQYKGNKDFVQTRTPLTSGQTFKFEDLCAFSRGGDLNTDFYKHYEGRIFMVVSTMDTRVRTGWIAEEVSRI